MRNKLLASAAAIVLSGTFAVAAFADTGKPQHMTPEAREKMVQSFCADHTARVIGHLAYLDAKLKPTAAQEAAWKSYNDAVTADAKAREKDCLARPAKHEGRPSIVERQAMMEKGLEARLASLKATTPALQSLYATLSDDQKAVLDRDHPDGMRHFADWRHGHDGRGMMHKARFDGDRKGPPPMDGPDAPAAPTAD